MKHRRPNALIVALVVIGSVVIFSLPIIFNMTSPLNDQTSEYEAESNVTSEGSGTTSIEDILDAVDEHNANRRVKAVSSSKTTNKADYKPKVKTVEVKSVKSSRKVTKLRPVFGALQGIAGALQATGRRRVSE